MKHSQTITPTHPKSVPKAASARSVKTAQRTMPQGNGHARDELVRLTAYSLYEARHGANGSDLDDWLRAEAQVDQLSVQSGSFDEAVEVSPRAGLND